MGAPNFSTHSASADPPGETIEMPALDRGFGRPSVSSLQRDINDAIRTAATLNVPPQSSQHKRRSTVDTLATATSANSLVTRTNKSSYLDFEKYQPWKRARMADYGLRARKVRDRLAVAPTAAGTKVLRMLRRPFSAVHAYWRRRRQLPPTKAGRRIPLDMEVLPQKLTDERTNKPYVSNVVTSAIYTAYDFVPRQLVIQFSKLANLYFLFVSILQMIPSWSTTGNYTTIVPLCIFVMISMGREGYEDWCRSRSDKDENNRTVLVARRSAKDSIEYESTPWKKVKVGDVVRVLQNEWIPADLVLLHSSGMKGQCSIETLALDGETTLKNREVPTDVQEAFRIENLDTAKLMCTTEDPNLDLFNFDGSLEIEGKGLTPLTNANIVYRGCALRNTASILGLVVFTGQETKLQLNASENSRSKAPKLQGKVNKVIFLLACFVMLLSGFSTLAAGRIQASHQYWYLEGIHVTTTQNIMGFIIMFNTLIPLSLYVSMEICKVFQLFLMENDVDLYDPVNDVRCSVQSASLNEELGQVSYVFSDKTGTLTDNIMLFRKLSIAGHAWIHDLDLFFDDDEEGYLFHKAQAKEPTELDSAEYQLLEQLARLPRKSFGGRISNNARISVGRPSIGRPSLGGPLPQPPISPGRLSGLATPRIPNARPSVASPMRASGVSRNSMASAGPPPRVGSPLSHPTWQPTTSVPLEAPDISHGQDSSEAAPRPSGVGWQSTAAPAKPQETPSTLALLEFIMTHPHSAFTQRAKFFLLSLALCHTASPEVDLNREADGTLEIEQLDYQAASPDELALVAAARDLGYLVIDRQYDSITVRTYPNGFDNPAKDEVYKVLDTIEFTSSRKRMSVIVQFPDGRIVLLCKGADNIMVERLKRSLLGVAHQKQDSLYEEARARRSIEAELANENRSFRMGMSQSIDQVLELSHLDAAIYERGRQSIQVRRSIAEHAQQQQQHQQHTGRRSGVMEAATQAVADATAAAAVNATVTGASVDMSRASVQTPRLRTSMSNPGSRNPSPQRNRNASPHRNRNSSPQRHHTVPHSPSHTGSYAMNHTTQPTPSHTHLEIYSEQQALERTLEQVDEFSTEGLRTLLYGHRFLSHNEYKQWKAEYDEARLSLVDRQEKIDAVGEKLEHDLDVTGATAIEDKLQKGVPETIDKLRRANIRLWMLTGDKRETAVNIGYSCRLIKDHSTVITLKSEDDLEAKVMAALEELEQSNIAHCVVVIDGQTLAHVEKDAILLSLFVDLGLRADSVIVCRASPAQKAEIVKSVRRREPSKVMLAIGDGANDIAMIQSADVGVGIAGREGLQAARASDFAIGQFRFLVKLLFVHGRWNYVRTCKYILATFYKEFFFYMGQVVYQRNTMFTGTSLYESWSISMFNTLFTSLPVMCIGIMDQDLTPTTLVALPELYKIGPENKEFGFGLFFYALCVAMLECLMVNFLAYIMYGGNMLVRDLSIFPLGVVVYASVVALVCFKFQFVTMIHYITLISVLVVVISVGGYLLWNILISAVYIVRPSKTYWAESEYWDSLGKELSFWATVFLALIIGILFEVVLKMVVTWLHPTDTLKCQVMEKDPYVMQRLEDEAELELSQGWEYQDRLDHSWTAIFRGKWPGQPRMKIDPSEVMGTSRFRKRDRLAEMLHLRKHDYDKEIQEILERRQREMDEQEMGRH